MSKLFDVKLAPGTVPKKMEEPTDPRIKAYVAELRAKSEKRIAMIREKKAIEQKAHETEHAEFYAQLDYEEGKRASPILTPEERAAMMAERRRKGGAHYDPVIPTFRPEDVPQDMQQPEPDAMPMIEEEVELVDLETGARRRGRPPVDITAPETPACNYAREAAKSTADRGKLFDLGAYRPTVDSMPGDMMRSITEYVAARVQESNPGYPIDENLLLTGVLSSMQGIAGNTYRYCDTNISASWMTIGRTGVGKDIVAKSRGILNSYLDRNVGCLVNASGTGITSKTSLANIFYAENKGARSVSVFWPEFSRMSEKISTGEAMMSFFDTLKSMLNNGKYGCRDISGLADAKRGKEIPSDASITLVCETQDHGALSLLSHSGSQDDGTLNRFIFVRATGEEESYLKGKYVSSEYPDVPRTLKSMGEQLLANKWNNQDESIDTPYREHRDIRCAEGVYDWCVSTRKEIDYIMKNMTYKIGRLTLMRAQVNIERIACVLAYMEDHVNPVVTNEMLDWAKNFVFWQIQRISMMAMVGAIPLTERRRQILMDSMLCQMNGTDLSEKVDSIGMVNNYIPDDFANGGFSPLFFSRVAESFGPAFMGSDRISSLHNIVRTEITNLCESGMMARRNTMWAKSRGLDSRYTEFGFTVRGITRHRQIFKDRLFLD